MNNYIKFVTPINTPSHTPIKTSVPQQTQTSLTLPFSDTEFPPSPFNITPTHSPPSLFPIILILVILILDYSGTKIIQLHVNLFLFLLPSSLSVSQTILNLITLFQFIQLVPIYHLNLHPPHLKPLNFLQLNRLIPFKKNLISVKLIQQLPRSFIHVFLLQIPLLNTLLLLSITFSKPLLNPPFANHLAIDIISIIIVVLLLLSQVPTLLFYDAQSLSTDSLLIPDNAPTSGIDTAFSQRSSLSSYNETGHLSSLPISQNPSVLSSDSHLLNIDLTTDQYSTPPTPNRVDYPSIVNDTVINSPRQDPRFLYLATYKLNSNPSFSNERRRKEFHRLDNTNLEIKIEITAKFHNLSPHPIPSHTTVNFKSLPHHFIATILSHL